MPANGLNAQTASELHSKRAETAFKRSNEPNTPTGLKRPKRLQRARNGSNVSNGLETAQTAIFRANKCRHTHISCKWKSTRSWAREVLCMLFNDVIVYAHIQYTIHTYCTTGFLRPAEARASREACATRAASGGREWQVCLKPHNYVNMVSKVSECE